MQEAIGQRLRLARELLGMDQETVAAAIDKKHSAISKIESGKQNVPNSLITFFNSKGVSLEWLQYGTGEMLKAAGGAQSVRIGRIKGSGNAAGIDNKVEGADDAELNRQLAEAIHENEKLKIALEGIDKQLQEKDERIQELKEMIAYLKSKS